MLGRVREKRSEKSLLLTGLRGVGKTVLLNEIARKAELQSYRTIIIEAHEACGINVSERQPGVSIGKMLNP